MGNSLGGRKKRTAKVMKIDGSAFRPKPPVTVGDVLRDYPGHSVLDAAEVKSFGVRARPLDAGDPLLAGRLYFLVNIPRLPAHNADANPRRAFSGNLRPTAKDRLEALQLTRRAVSDLSLHHRSTAAVEASPDGGMRLRLRLPKSEVAKLVEGSRDPAEAAQKIAKFAATVTASPAPSSTVATRKEKKTRFTAMPEEIIA
ncbi:hypothetical protein HPP92_023167 [Vanilla planifolia]|uniref:Plastid movement impaired protein n=1 Tax=Vanilla planifolia TaxID=51239 RepID=A0A835PUM4_VANPL|nr:hypothetical protein HPP92_023487 [Vanilla planifolia]KAG0460039.1 hypothetical protein HPP92_023167 [Vanilla planifolia]